MKEYYEGKEQRKKEIIQKKKDQKESEIEVIKLWATWKGLKIGKYTGLVPPYPFIEKIKQNLVNWDQVNFLVTKDAPLKNFNL